MGVYIKGMDMPTNCFYCPLSVLGGERLFCEVTKDEVVRAKRSSDCRLVEVKTPHGRLIDADDAFDTMTYEMCGTGYQSEATSVLRYESMTPTVLESDGTHMKPDDFCSRSVKREEER